MNPTNVDPAVSWSLLFTSATGLLALESINHYLAKSVERPAPRQPQDIARSRTCANTDHTHVDDTDLSLRFIANEWPEQRAPDLLNLISPSMKESVERVTESTVESSSAQVLVSAPVCAAEPLARLVNAAEPAAATEQLPYSWNNRPQSGSIGAIVCDGDHTAITCGTCGAAMTAPSMSNGTRLFTKTHAVVGYDATSLIFPIGVDANTVDDRERPGDGDASQSVRSQVNWRLDQCERTRFLFKKKLILDDMKLTHKDIPMKDLCGTALGNSLHKLSLAKNRLCSIPAKLVVSLPVLQTLDLSQCELHQLPEHFNLPRLKRLLLRHNRFSYFPDEAVLEGLPDLQELDLYGNRISEIVVPCGSTALAKLKVLDLGYNDIMHLPEELDQLKSLRTLKLLNNFLSLVPMRVCDMDLKVLDVTSNPVMTPPLDTCDHGICSMKRYWAQIRLEEQNKKRANMRSYQVQLQQHRMHNRFLASQQHRAVEETPYEARPRRRYGNASGSHSSRAAHSRIEFINPLSAIQSGANRRDQVGTAQGWNAIDGGSSTSTLIGSESSAEMNTRTAIATLTPVEQVEEPVSVGRPASLAVDPKSCEQPGLVAGAEHESATTVMDSTASTDSLESQHTQNSKLGKPRSLEPTAASLPGLTTSTTVDQEGRDNLAKSANPFLCVEIQDRLRRCTAPAGCCFSQKRLWLNDLHLRDVDIPIPNQCGTALGETLYQLSLANNPMLGSIPPQLVTSLPALRILDVSQCNLRSLPEFFCLPKLQSLSLRFNCLTDFLDERVWEGLPELKELDLYGNKLSEIHFPLDAKLKLTTLDLGYNDLVELPDSLDQLASLRTLRLANNFLSVVPIRICCHASLTRLDVTGNPVRTPPLDVCERGVHAMKRFYLKTAKTTP